MRLVTAALALSVVLIAVACAPDKANQTIADGEKVPTAPAEQAPRTATPVAALLECITDSKPPVPPASNILRSWPCARSFGSVEATRGGKTVTLQYMVHEPARAKAVVVLFAGGNGDAGIILGPMPMANRNFLVRSAQLFAERGYRALTVDRPLLGVGPPKVPEYNDEVAYDRYRISDDHAFDLAAVLAVANPDGNLKVFFAGTSSGAMSAVAQHALSAAISISSPKTSSGGASLFVGRPGYPNLQPESLKVPVAILVHESDGCFASTPANANELYRRFREAGVEASFSAISGGFDVTGAVLNMSVVSACDPFTPHGFLGVETKAVMEITNHFDAVLRRPR